MFSAKLKICNPYLGIFMPSFGLQMQSETQIMDRKATLNRKIKAKINNTKTHLKRKKESKNKEGKQKRMKRATLQSKRWHKNSQIGIVIFNKVDFC
jgi:hypothetical protein